MNFTDDQIIAIQSEREDLRFLPSNIDFIIMEFLRIYDVDVVPRKVGEWNGWDSYASVSYFLSSNPLSNISSTMISTNRSNQINSQAQDWNTWKKWALDHKDFEKFKIKRIAEIEAFNKSILEKINSDDLKNELEEIIIRYKDKKFIRIREGKIIFGVCTGLSYSIGQSPVIWRLLFIGVTILLLPISPLIYLILAVALPIKDRKLNL